MINPVIILKSNLQRIQGIVDFKQGKVTTVMPFIIFLVAMALGFFLFFNRYPLFHDEIINTYKAHTGLVFDYALRPVFYFLNYLFYHFLGNAPRSLTVAAVIYYAITAALLYAIGQRHFGLLGGFLCSFIFMFLPLVIHMGIRGMPHLPAGMFSVFMIYFLSKIFRISSGKMAGWYMFTIGIFGVVTLATHPTMIGISFALFLWAFVGWAFKGKWFTVFYPEILNRKHFFRLLVSFISAFVLLNLLYLYFDGRSYISILLAGITRTNNPVYSGYFQPWYYYLNKILLHGKVINISLLFIVGYYFIVRLMHRSKSAPDSSQRNFLFTVLVATVIFLVFISLSKWKFERVFVSFIPFYALSAGLIISFVVKGLINNKNAVIYSLLSFMLILAGGVWGVVSFNDYAKEVKDNIHKEKERYYGLYDQIQNLNVSKIGVIGGESYQAFARRYIIIADKEPVVLANNFSELKRTHDRNAMFKMLMSNEVEYFMMRSGENSLNDSTQQDYLKAFDWLVSVGATRLYSWRGLTDLWHFDQMQHSSEVDKNHSLGRQPVNMSGFSPRTVEGVK